MTELHIDPLFPDRYVGDPSGDVIALMNAGPPWHGFGQKLTQGTWHNEVNEVLKYRKLMLSHPRYGVDFFEFFYAYADLSQDPVKQFDYFWSMMQVIGGEQRGTLWPMLDFERGGQRFIPPVEKCFDFIRKWSDRCNEIARRRPILYAGELLRSLGIDTTKYAEVETILGCSYSAIASYTQIITGRAVEESGSDYKHFMFWQYCGDGLGLLDHYPTQTPGFGKLDISTMVLPGGITELARLQKESLNGRF